MFERFPQISFHVMRSWLALICFHLSPVMSSALGSQATMDVVTMWDDRLATWTKLGMMARDAIGNVGIAIINHPPFITISMDGIDHQFYGWCQWHCYTHIIPFQDIEMQWDVYNMILRRIMSMHMIDRTARVKGLRASKFGGSIHDASMSDCDDPRHLRHRTSLPPLDGKGQAIHTMHLLPRTAFRVDLTGQFDVSGGWEWWDCKCIWHTKPTIARLAIGEFPWNSIVLSTYHWWRLGRQHFSWWNSYQWFILGHVKLCKCVSPAHILAASGATSLLTGLQIPLWVWAWESRRATVGWK